MQFNYKFKGNTAVNSGSTSTNMSFAPDLNRKPTFFISSLRKSIPFREAISALHDVVVSDMRFKPRDISNYKEWLASQEKIWLAEIIGSREEFVDKFKELSSQLESIKAQKRMIKLPFQKAKKEYFKYIYKNDYDKWFVLDPVITVHPDEIFFECFSQDESSYGKLSCDYDVFENISEHSYGTTNIDYSERLYDEFQKIREYKETKFIIDPSGFEVQTQYSDDFREEKIDLPDSWVRGFLQISSAMSLEKTSFELMPIDIYNILLYLKRNREKKSPRSLKFILIPDKKIELIIEPWNKRLKFSTIFKGQEAKEIRIWGRRRLFILERVLSVAKKFKVSLLGSGMPSFWEADLGGMRFTLGLSGWSANDWSGSGNFDLMATRESVDSDTASKVFDKLSKKYVATTTELSSALNIDTKLISSALNIYAQEGRVLFDMSKNIYRLREISAEPLPMNRIRFSNPQEEKALKLLNRNSVNIENVSLSNDKIEIKGSIKDRRKVETSLIIDEDLRIKDAKCSCRYFYQNRLYKGPCEHILALKIKWQKEK
jgi:hypothetical protein